MNWRCIRTLLCTGIVFALAFCPSSTKAYDGGYSGTIVDELPCVGAATATVNEQSLQAFILDYLRAVESNDVSKQKRLFADPVNFHGEAEFK